MDKYDELDIDIKNSFAFDYKSEKEAFEKRGLTDYSCDELEQIYDSFQTLLKRITQLSKDYFEELIENKTTTHDNKLYFDLSSVYISEIQDIYLNKISYRLNQKNNSKSLSLAWVVAIISFILSAVSIGLTIYYGNVSYEKDESKFTKETVVLPLSIPDNSIKGIDTTDVNVVDTIKVQNETTN